MNPDGEVTTSRTTPSRAKAAWAGARRQVLPSRDERTEGVPVQFEPTTTYPRPLAATALAQNRPKIVRSGMRLHLSPSVDSQSATRLPVFVV